MEIQIGNMENVKDLQQESHDKASLIELGYHVSSKAGKLERVAMDEERIKTVLEGALKNCTITRIHVTSGNVWFNAITNLNSFINSSHEKIEIIEVTSITRASLGIYGYIERENLYKLYDENRN